MAERRMLHKKASVSSDLAALRDKQGADALSFFLLMIPHLDRWGCVPDNPTTLRGMVVPLWEDVTSKDVKRWVEWMVRRGMLERVTGPDGDRGLRSPDFHEHQRRAEFHKEAPSPYEPRSITESWGKTTPNAGRSTTTRRPIDDDSSSPRRERKGKEGKAKLSPSVPSGERGVGKGGESGSAGRGQPASPVVVDEEEGRLAREEMARAFSRSERTRPFMSLMKGGQDG